MNSPTEKTLHYFGKNNEHRVVFYPNSHWYKLIVEDGHRLDKPKGLPSPSTIAGMLDKSPQLMKWATEQMADSIIEKMGDGSNFTQPDVLNMIEASKKAYAEKREKAATIGTIVHDYAETGVYPEQELAELNDQERTQAKTAMSAFDHWLRDEGITIVSKEQVVYSRRYGYAGKYDAIIETPENHNLVLVDYKTANNVYPEYILQLSAYIRAHNEWRAANTKDYIKSGMIITFTKDTGEYRITHIDYNMIREAFECFKGFLKTKQFIKSLNK